MMPHHFYDVMSLLKTRWDVTMLQDSVEGTGVCVKYVCVCMVISLHIHTRIDFICNHLFTKNLRNKDKRYQKKKKKMHSGKKILQHYFSSFVLCN